MTRLDFQADRGSREEHGVRQVPHTVDQPAGETFPDRQQHHDRRAAGGRRSAGEVGRRFRQNSATHASPPDGKTQVGHSLHETTRDSKSELSNI